MFELSVNARQGAYPESAPDWFNFEELDAFHTAEVLGVVHGSAWMGVLITDGQAALLHAFRAQPLPQGPGFDIDPFIGYAGPVLSAGATAEFRERALRAYSQWCREQDIVAEITRFSPVLHNDAVFADSGQLVVFQAKELVVSSCHDDEAAQLAAFASKCRSSVRRGMRDCTTRRLDKATEWDNFVAFYYASLDRIGADRRWYYSPEFFACARQSAVFQAHGVFQGEALASAALLIEQPRAGYYFLAASSEPAVQGANEFLIYSLCRHLARQGTAHLILGGGNTAQEDDPLLRFKRKFAPDLTPLVLGKMVHQPAAFAQLVAAAVARQPELAEVRFFLKYRI